ncbi:phosphoenolpyruvate carboxykinase (ATP) [Altererythrobacter lutimaris]|uniref:HPr kinase/phosphorylase C-terminal domain-containing protein n=1 Tax=Altererythrobacter lutimaris TaxID=2743979 RepID=A0A850HIT6_9SPHN|nr:hypothetical protein [Altererythrobacter lutimaris]NVE95712.1 hypothetical protein [Altererythrobacter lutimaris]
MSGFLSWLKLPMDEAAREAQDVVSEAMDCRLEEDVRIVGRDRLEGPLLYEQDDFALAQDAFWFKTPAGVQFSYQVGETVRAWLPDPQSAAEYEIFLWGTVYGAVAWLNGLIPLHASCVVMAHKQHDNASVLPQAIAFTGDSGAGKSTLAASLAVNGASQLCDDTLVVIPACDGLVALPDNKPLKLWADSLALLQLDSRAEISAVPGKHYAHSARRMTRPCMLADLIVLQVGSEFVLQTVEGRHKLAYLPAALYRDIIHIKRADHKLHGRVLTELATKLRIWTLTRPKEPGDFRAELGEVERLLQAIE